MYMLYLISVLGTNPRKSMELAEKCFEGFQMLHVCKIYLHVAALIAPCSTKVSLRAYTLAGTHIAIAVPVDMI